MSAVPLHDLDEVAAKGAIAELRAEPKPDMAHLRIDVSRQRGALRKIMTTWMLTIAVANIGAVVSVALIVR